MVLWSCGRAHSPESSTQVPLDAGGLVALSDMADLRGSTKAPIDNLAVWVPQPVAAGRGWGRVLRGWSPAGERATMTFRTPARSGSTLEVGFLQRNAAPIKRHQVEVRLNGGAVGSFNTATGAVSHRLFLPPGLLTELNQVELRFEPAVEERPEELQGYLSLVSFGIQQDDRLSEPVRGFSSAQLREGEELTIQRPGVLVVPWKIPALAEELKLEAEGLGSGNTTLEIFALLEDGDPVELLRTVLKPGRKARHSMQISRMQGERVTLCLQFLPSARGEGARIGELWVESGSPEPEDAATVKSLPAFVRRPDILLVVLDAARGDRFPGWDYPREVMPNLEELSQSSLSFRNAFTECPTTSCSIPALVTGVPFLPGGEVGRGQKLSDEVTTLAEYLRQMGYSTVGFSATPNNSASRNLDQGFDTFRELWGRGNPDHGPFNMSRLAIEVIQSQPRDEPLFLQLHYLPPHQPYAPGPEFDRFTDPEYRGPIRPHMSLDPINDGRLMPSASDLEHLIGLYDGNLLLADYVVGQVFAALRSAGRFENTLIVITSDHGEAFMEHGMVNHNTTLFDEMLHVPLIIRLPNGDVPAEIDRNRLASTLDVVPTVLGYLGTPSSASLGGVDLLHTRPDPRDPRMLFLRTSHLKHRMVAARTRKWKQISWPRLHVQMLFDLEVDPREEDNLVSSHPYVYAGMGLRLRTHMIEAAARRLEAEEMEVTAEEEEALRALGYLE
jgi:arylsulfatase A-like enzyme